MHPGLSDRRHTEAHHRSEEQGQDRLGLGQQEPLHSLRPRQAVHRLRGALPGLAQSHQTRRGRNEASDGRVAVQKGPVLDLELCTGCGICENKCPIVDDPAIFVTSVGETRSERNRLLLQIPGEPSLAPPVDPYK